MSNKHRSVLIFESKASVITALMNLYQREKEQGPAMHRAFHKDLCRMRLETARAYVKTLTEGYMVILVIITIFDPTVT